MANEEIAQRVKKVILDKLVDVKDEQIVDSATFAELGADSLDKTELVMGLEDEFKIEIQDSVSEKFQTVGDVVKFLAEKQ